MFYVIADYLKNQWKLIRDAYMRCISKREKQTRSGAATTKLSRCKYFEILSFLKGIGEPTKADSNVDITINEEPKEVHEKKTIEPYRKPILKVKNVEAMPAVDRMLLSSLTDVSNSCKAIKDNENDNNDSNALFCKSLIVTLSNLPQRKNKKARIKIQQVLYDIEFEED